MTSRTDPVLQRFGMLILELAFAAMFSVLLIQTLSADSEVSVPPMVNILTPVFAGALGLLLARALGVEPSVTGAADLWGRIRAILSTTSGLLRLGAWIYLLAGLAGGIVWGIKGSLTPELVTVLVLTTAGYLAAMFSNLSQP